MGGGGWISSTTIKPHDWFQCWSRRRICEEWFFQIWRDVMARGCESRGSKIWPDMVSSFPRAILCVQWPLSYGKQRGFRSWHSMSRWCVKEQESKIGSFTLKMDPVWIAFTRTSGWVDQLQSDEAALTTIIEHVALNPQGSRLQRFASCFLDFLSLALSNLFRVHAGRAYYVPLCTHWQSHPFVCG